jgi:DNA polymerase I
MSDKKDLLVLFDGNALLHRAYHAYPQTLRTASGELTNASYGFTSTLLSVIRQFKPSHVAVAFDEKAPTFRHKKFKGYKASRPKMDDELVSQIERTREIVRTFNIPTLIKSGFEADDILGTIGKQFADKFDEIVIVTGDKDILQLLSDKVKVYYPSRGRFPAKLYDVKRFEKEYEFTPIQMIDFKGLAGDSSDEIPGVKGVGKVTATRLIKEFGEMEKIYENLEAIKGSVKDKLEKDKELAFLSKELATIVLDCSIEFTKKGSLLVDYDKNKVIKLFEELEFKSLIRRLPSDEWEDEVERIMNGKAKSEKPFVVKAMQGRQKEKSEKAENQMGLF